MEENKKRSDELNYKQAYLFLFQQITEIIEKLKFIQENVEEICIDETVADSAEINAE